MNKTFGTILVVIVVIGVVIAAGALYVVDETQQVVVTQFGEPIGEPVTQAGLYFKIPFIQAANHFEKRVLRWDGDPNQVPTKDKRYILVDATARWKIVDALKFMQAVGSVEGGYARLDDVIDATVRDVVSNFNLIETVRNSNAILERIKEQEDVEGYIEVDPESLERIKVGRDGLTREILERARTIVPRYGIELVDVRLKRIDYIKEVQQRVFERMISERKRAAEQYRSEGQGKKAEIEGQMQKELEQIQSEAYRTVQELRGKADAEATNIYAEAYNKDPEFYSFLKTLQTYERTIDSKSTLILTTDSDYFEYLKKIDTPKLP
jgi:membrane protease subunit HflC